MKSITQFITQKLKLKVNESKSAVAKPQERKFLGFSFIDGPEVKRAIAPKSLVRLSGESGRSHDAQRASASKRRCRNWPHICGAGAAISASAKLLASSSHLLAGFCRETRILAEKFDWAIEISGI
jgi:hypothetical protein